MFEKIEQFLFGYQYTVATLGVLASFSVACISLWLARNQTKTKLKINLDICRLDGSEDSYIAVRIINKGLLPVRIPFGFFRWELLDKRTEFPIPIDSCKGQNIPRKQYPTTIQPKSSELFILNTEETFLQQLNKSKCKGLLKNNSIKFTVVTDDGQEFKVKPSSELIQTLYENLNR